MTIGVVFTILLVGVLILIMLGLGMSLTPADFKRIAEKPRAVTLGLLGQLILMPAIALLLAMNLNLSSEIAIGMLIVSICPGGPTSNAFSHVAGGDTALSVTLTALSSSITPFTIPIFLNFVLWMFLKETGEVISFPIARAFVQIVIVTIIPITLGMFIRARWPAFCRDTEKPIRKMAIIFLVIIVGMLVYRDRYMFLENMSQGGVMVFLYGASAIILATFLATIGKLNNKQRLTIGIEVGIQNCLFAILIASSPAMLNNEHYAIFPAMYGTFMYITIVAYIWGFKRLFRIEESLI